MPWKSRDKHILHHIEALLMLLNCVFFYLSSIDDSDYVSKHFLIFKTVLTPVGRS